MYKLICKFPIIILPLVVPKEECRNGESYFIENTENSD